MNSGSLRYRIGDGPWEGFSASGQVIVRAGEWLRFDLASGGCWYGYGFAHRQPYPLNAEPVINSRFAVNNIQSPIWMCSAGFALLAETTELLEVRISDGGKGWLEVRCPAAALPVTVFHGCDLTEAHRCLMASLHWPPPAPAKELLGDSIFCTWTQYPRAITQERIVGMAREIRSRQYPCSVLTIDDRWESAYGDLEFSADFPEPRRMMEELHALGFRVMLWVTPFVNCEAAAFQALSQRGLLARRKDGGGPALFKWWGGTAGIVDVTNPEARARYREQLLRLRNDIGVDGFKIDGGDAKYQPPIQETAWHDYAGPSGYVDAFLAIFEEVAPGLCESRTAWLSPQRNILWREGGKDSHWGVDNGLKAMVHLGLHLSLLGYDILIPDMVPGRIQTMVSTLPLPSDELFIRWVEASALMPIMQFSYFPWHYAEPTAEIAVRYAQLHKALENYLHEQASSRARPLLRPLWYDAPECPELYSVGDEFLLGDHLLAAPVLAENQVARDIILPPGVWIDAWTGEKCEGRLLQHPAPCPGMPLFVRSGCVELLGKVIGALRSIRRGAVSSGTISASYEAGLDRDINVTG